MPQMYDLKLTLREGVKRLVNSIPSRYYPDILAYGRSQKIRPGLPQLIDFLASRGIDFVVVSGGLKGMIEAYLSTNNLLTRIKDIHGVDLDISQEFLQVQSNYEGETELVAKVEVIKSYGECFPIAIGDSVTDLNMAMYCPLVFARAPLTNYLSDRQKTYVPWGDFHDIHRYLLDYL